jgi:hypothetical protein
MRRFVLKEARMLPEARQEKLLVQEVGEELVGSDQDRHRACRLNRTPPGSAATATGKNERSGAGHPCWQASWACRRMKNWSGCYSSSWRKSTCCGSPSRARPRGYVSRLEVVRKLMLAGALPLLLAVVSSLTPPPPAMALISQCQPTGGECLTGDTCVESDQCCEGTECVPRNVSNLAPRNGGVENLWK